MSARILGVPETCALSHPLFARFGPVLFRRSDADGAPVMVVPLGDKEAALSLASVRREFGIAPGSADARMLELIEQALDYVSAIAIGDRLPSEIRNGRASWQPRPNHRIVARNRLRGQLVVWLDPSGAQGLAGGEDLDDAGFRTGIHDALEQAAKLVGLPDGEAVLGLIEEVAEELAYIEALREDLLNRLLALLPRLDRLGSGRRGDLPRMETIAQVQRLARVAAQRIGSRFAEVDAQTGEVLGTLRNIGAQRAFIRENRDWLYRNLRAWDPILTLWADQADVAIEAMWPTIVATYHFLAQRYMQVTEWQAFNRAISDRPKKIGQSMVW
jgi:hypothetical protein